MIALKTSKRYSQALKLILQFRQGVTCIAAVFSQV